MTKVTLQEIAKMIDHSLLHPTMDDQTLKDGIELARKHDVASVCIKPYAVKSCGYIPNYSHQDSKIVI